jgi:hypothetical protein
LTVRSGAFDGAKDKEEDYRADRCGYDRAKNAAAKGNAESWEEETGNKGADDTNNQITHQAEPATANELTGKPTRNQTHQQKDKKTFSTHSRFSINRFRYDVSPAPDSSIHAWQENHHANGTTPGAIWVTELVIMENEAGRYQKYYTGRGSPRPV